MEGMVLSALVHHYVPWKRIIFIKYEINKGGKPGNRFFVFPTNRQCSSATPGKRKK